MEQRKYNEKQIVLFVGFGVLAILSLVLRYSLLKYRSTDYNLHILPWYDFLKSHGIHGLKDDFSYYNLPYLYMLYAVTLLPIPKIAAVKGISIFFDLVLASGVFFVVKHYNPRNYLPEIAALVTLFLPTVVLNSAMWGQSDSLYTAFLVFSFYFALKKQFTLFWAMWAIAFGFKLQAVFFLPFLLMMTLRYRQWIKPFICIPIWIILVLPGLILGRSLSSILNIYVSQAGTFRALTLNAPNLYQWLPNALFTYFHSAGIVFTVAVALVLVLVIYSRDKYSDVELLLAITLFLFVVPFCLPQMHERYFYPAEVFSLLGAFVYRPIIWYAPVMQFVTLCAYSPFLFGVAPVVPLGIDALFVLAIIGHLTYQLFLVSHDDESTRTDIDSRVQYERGGSAGVGGRAPTG